MVSFSIQKCEISSQGLFVGLRNENLESFVWIFQSQRFDRSQFCLVGLADLLKPIGDHHLLLAEFGGDRPYPLIKIAN